MLWTLDLGLLRCHGTTPKLAWSHRDRAQAAVARASLRPVDLPCNYAFLIFMALHIMRMHITPRGVSKMPGIPLLAWPAPGVRTAGPGFRRCYVPDD